jgi:hypothetical protein
VTVSSTIVLLVIAGWPSVSADAPPREAGMRFGMDIPSLQGQQDAGVAPDYATVWVGPWTHGHAWDGFQRLLHRVYDAGATPVVHFYYWGDDISRSCVLDGCQSRVHGVWKDAAGWDALAQDLLLKASQAAGDQAIVIVLETEFNKNGVEECEHFDGLLAEKAKFLRAGLPGAQIVMGLGNWGPGSWKTWDRAAAASDAVGLQGIRGSSRDSQSVYYDVVDATIAGARKAGGLFGKPVFLTDIALSSWPYSDYAEHQEAVLASFFTRMGDLRDAGVEAFVYRSLRNNENYNPKDYYGQAEGGWGLQHPDGRWKPAMSVWVDGVKTQRLETTMGPLEAEAFDRKDNGVSYADGSASGNRAWNLWADGAVRHELVVPEAGHYAINVKAAGTRFEGVGPHMVVTVDGVRVFSGTVDTTGGFGSHWGGFDAVGRGAYELVIRFTNDATGGGEDRNLLLDRVVLIAD